MIVINKHRVERVATLFKILGIEKVKIFEDIDPQYLLIKQTIAKCMSENIMYAFYINALIAYKLRMKGEEFWKKFAEFVVNNCEKLKDIKSLVEIVNEFTRKYNNYSYRNKFERIMKIIKCSSILKLVIDGRYVDLAKKSAECLKTSYESKTIVFAVKIAYYFHKIQNPQFVLPFELPIPVDRRIAYISFTSGVVDISGAGNKLQDKDIILLLLRKTEIVRNIWNIVATISSIPPLHIDAVLWYLGKYAHMNDKSKIFESAYRDLYMIDKELLKQLIDELYYRFL